MRLVHEMEQVPPADAAAALADACQRATAALTQRAAAPGPFLFKEVVLTRYGEGLPPDGVRNGPEERRQAAIGSAREALTQLQRNKKADVFLAAGAAEQVAQVQESLARLEPELHEARASVEQADAESERRRRELCLACTRASRSPI
jgi:hypothetical protein